MVLLGCHTAIFPSSDRRKHLYSLGNGSQEYALIEQFKRMKSAYVGWHGSVHGTVAFTGTFKLCRRHAETGALEWIDVEKARRTVEIFVGRAGRSLFGRKAERSGQKLSYAATIEGSVSSRGGDTRLHVHMAIAGIPLHHSFAHVEAVLQRRWEQLPWGYGQTDVQLFDSDSGRQAWNMYTFKNFSIDNTDRYLTNISL